MNKQITYRKLLEGINMTKNSEWRTEMDEGNEKPD